MITKKNLNETTNPDPDDMDLRPEDPLAIYADPVFKGKADTLYEKLRRFSHKSKRVVYYLFLISIVWVFFWNYQNSEPASTRDMATRYFGRFSGQSSDWFYNIEHYYFGNPHLARLYEVLLKFTWGTKGAAEKSKEKDLFTDYLKQQFETDLIVHAAIETGILNSTESRLIMENAVRNAIAEYYIFKQINNHTSDFRITVTDEEALVHYRKNRQLFDKNNLGHQATIQIIKNTLNNMKRDRLREELLMKRNKIVEDLKNRTAFRIRNLEKTQ